MFLLAGLSTAAGFKVRRESSLSTRDKDSRWQKRAPWTRNAVVSVVGCSSTLGGSQRPQVIARPCSLRKGNGMRRRTVEEKQRKSVYAAEAQCRILKNYRT